MIFHGDSEIILENGALCRVGEQFALNRKVLVVTDSGVPQAYADTVAASCASPVRVCIPAGEAGKVLEQWQLLLHTMLENDFGRGDCVVAVGGGVVGDLSGFAAACYMRGIDFYNIPTTLLAQVDSSVGGKTAVDFEGTKNIIGAFYPPRAVLIDPDTLRTLDARQYAAGMAEIIKMAAIGDASLFADLARGHIDLTDMIARALQIKLRVVGEDLTEKGLRKVLNFGHTLGHAIEACGKGTLLHGECVALGMLPMCADAVRETLRRVLVQYGLPTKIPFAAEEMRPYLIHDKKSTADGISTVWVDAIGSFRFETCTPAVLLRRLEETV